MKSFWLTYIIKISFLIPPVLAAIPLSGQGGNLLRMNSSLNSGDNNISSKIDLQTNYIKDFYSRKIEVPKELINGKEYESYYARSKVKPLLYLTRERTASLITKTRSYNNLILQYDTFLDEVVYTDTSRTFNYRFPQIALNKDIIDGFILYFKDETATFRYLRAPESTKLKLIEGFYEIAYEGKSSYFIKHESSFYVREGLNNYKYAPVNLISVDNTFIKVKTMKNLLALFGERTGQVEEFIKASWIKTKRPDKNQIVRILKFYDSLVDPDK